MPEESSQPTIPGPEIDNIISDLQVLSEKCKRDIANKFYWSTIYYCSEFNRILAQVKQIFPGRFEDVRDIVIDADALGEIRGGGRHRQIQSHIFLRLMLRLVRSMPV